MCSGNGNIRSQLGSRIEEIQGTGEMMNIKQKVLSVLGAGALMLTGLAGAAAQTADSPTQVPVDVVVGSPSGAGITWTVVVTSPWDDVVSDLDDAQDTTGAFAVTITDNRFTERGWEFSISANDFVGATTSDILPIENFYVNTGEVVALSSNAGTLPVASDFTMLETDQRLVYAAPGSGSGRYQVNVAGTVTIPANTVADTYETTINISLNAAP